MDKNIRTLLNYKCMGCRPGIAPIYLLVVPGKDYYLYLAGRQIAYFPSNKPILHYHYWGGKLRGQHLGTITKIIFSTRNTPALGKSKQARDPSFLWFFFLTWIPPFSSHFFCSPVRLSLSCLLSSTAKPIWTKLGRKVPQATRIW